MASESDYLSAAEIEAMRERARAYSGGDRSELRGDVADDRAALLRHHAALAAPADGEALGRIGWGVYRTERAILGQGWVAWDDMDDDSRAAFIAAALHLHAIGYAAGDPAREGEIATLRGERDALAKRLDLGPAEVVTLAAWEAQKATIARLTAELAATHDCGQADVCATPPGCQRHWEERNRELQAQIESFQRNSGCVDGYTIGDALAKIGASLDRTPTEGIPDAIERLKREKATARADGAREEREACAKVCNAIDHEVAEMISERIRARGDR